MSPPQRHVRLSVVPCLVRWYPPFKGTFKGKSPKENHQFAGPLKTRPSTQVLVIDFAETPRSNRLNQKRAVAYTLQYGPKKDTASGDILTSVCVCVCVSKTGGGGGTKTPNLPFASRQKKKKNLLIGEA